MHPITAWQLIRVLCYTQEYSTIQIYVIPQRGNHLLTVSLPVQRSLQNFDKKDLEKNSNWKLQIYKSTFSSIWLARFLLFLTIFLKTTEKQSWRVRAGWEFIQTVRGWNETTADFRLSRHRTAVAAFSPQLLPQASHAMRLTELSVSLSVQVQHEWWKHHLHWLQKRLLLFIPYPLARGGIFFIFFFAIPAQI